MVSFKTHIENICRTAKYKLHAIQRLRKHLILFWRIDLFYRNQFISLLCKSMGSLLLDRDLRHERGQYR